MSNSENKQIAERLLEQGVQKKREGEYKEAKRLYLESLRYNSESPEVFINLGKICYLLGESVFSIQAYIASMHLQINSREKKERGLIEYEYFSKTRNEGMYESLSNQLRSMLPRKSALVILQDPNTTRHISHSLNDYSNNTELKKYAEVYKATLEGGANTVRVLARYGLTENEYEEFDNTVYMNNGIEVLLKHIEWDKIMSTDVLNIYFKN